MCKFNSLKLHYYSIQQDDPDGVPGEETVSFPEETGPIKTTVPMMPGMPTPLGGLMGHHGLPIITHPGARR